MKINIIYSTKIIDYFNTCNFYILCKTLIFSLILSVSLIGQESNAFQAELIAGFNLSQLDGDQLSGFNKMGLRTGFRLSYPINDQKGLSLDLLFDQRGSSTGIISSGGFNQFIALDYISLPLSFYFDSWWNEETSRYKTRFYLSAIPSRLISTRSSHSDFDNAIDDFKKWDLSLSAGLRYVLGSRTAIDLRIERSIFRIYQSPTSQLSSLQSYLISLQFNYLLNQLN